MKSHFYTCWEVMGVLKMVWCEMGKLRRRRGLFWVSGIIAILPAWIMLVVRLINLSKDSQSHVKILEYVPFSFLVALMCAILAGAILGAWDQARGTARYLLMGGISRGRMMLSQMIAISVYWILLYAWAVAWVLLFSMVIPGSSGGYSDFLHGLPHNLFDGIVVALFAYGLGLAIGEVGVAVVVTILVYFASAIVLPIIGQLLLKHEWIQRVFLPDALARISESGHLWTSLAVILAWLGGILGLAWTMLRRRSF